LGFATLDHPPLHPQVVGNSLPAANATCANVWRLAGLCDLADLCSPFCTRLTCNQQGLMQTSIHTQRIPPSSSWR